MPQTTDAFFSTEITNHLFQKNQHRENFGLGIVRDANDFSGEKGFRAVSFEYIKVRKTFKCP